jgi:hypothetical protein
MVERHGAAGRMAQQIEDNDDMNKKNSTEKPRLSLRKATLANLSLVRGGAMMVNPRTDCICCKACATAAC